MTTSKFEELTAQIESLKIEAEEARKAECVVVISEIKAKIERYNLTPGDLFAGAEISRKSRVKKSKVAIVKGAIYQHSDGRIWSGKGRRPQWIIDAAATPEGIAQYQSRRPMG